MKITHQLAILIVPAVAAVCFVPESAEASFSITYSSGDWTARGHNYHRHRHKKHSHKYHKKEHYKHAHRRHHRRHFAYSHPRPYRPAYYRHHLARRMYDIPRGAKFVWINGHQFYTYHGAYYRRSDCGTYYFVVDNPHKYPAVARDEVHHYYSDTVYESNQQEFVVHIRAKNGELVTVRLQKENDGYIGPQGEFYPDFPKVAQLREMYVK